MKRKDLNKKLGLRKSTVSNLNTTELKGIYGGVTASKTHISCAPWVCMETQPCTCDCGPITLLTDCEPHTCLDC